MQESFLYYIWQFQYFDKKELTTCDGQKIQVLKPGLLNTHAGPDFANAKIIIDGIAWAGSVEIHTRSSDWKAHKHDKDPAYDNVILHVVWHNDNPAFRSDHTYLPILELKNRIDESLVKEYKKLIHTPFSIPCKKYFPQVNPVVRVSMLDRVMIRRLETKAKVILDLLKKNNNDWDETAFQVLARNFGFKVNNDAFSRLAKSLPYKILLKHADQPLQMEALLFGQAGFLDISAGDEYYKILQREYRVLALKYDLKPQKLVRAHWRFLRLRPANFPTVRLAQFCALLQQQKRIFSKILEAQTCKKLIQMFSIRQPDYWQNHYQFNRESKHAVAALGESSINSVLINSVIPLWVAYGRFNDVQSLVDRAISILQSIPAESNTIIKTWKEVGYVAQSAFDSQALIELYEHFCQPRNCLTCTIGVSLLKPTTVT